MDWDVVIAGGGPAGAAAAITGRLHDLRILVLEAEQFPRPHVGESLVHLWSVFDRFGVADEMDATFQHKRGSCRIWGDRPALEWTDFGSDFGGKPYSLQVERSIFDQILLRRAAETGATVRHGCRVQQILWEDERAVGVRYRTGDGEVAEARARWVIDATGRNGLIARDRRLWSFDPFFPDLSVYGYFRGARRFDGEHCGNLLIEVIPTGWLWFIPLHNGLVSVGLVCDRTSRGELRRLGPQAYLEQAVRESSVVGDLLRSATLEHGPLVTSSAGYRSSRSAGPGWILAGDAASFVDPMWATGVATALSDGMTAAIVVQAVHSGGIEEEAAVSYYEEQRDRRIDMDFSLVKFVYRANRLHGDSPFWTSRRDIPTSDCLPADRMMSNLARDPSMLYFREAFRGMGIEDGELVRLDDRIARLQRRGSLIPELMRDPGGWRPWLNEGFVIYRKLGIDSDLRLVEGTAIDDDGITDFVTDPHISAAFEALDGQRSLGDIADTVARTAPAGRRLMTRLEILASFVDAYERGTIEIDRTR
jgi:halogenation protein CepH